MVTISHLVQKHVSERPLLLDGMLQDLISFTNLAEQLKPIFEKELGKEVHEQAIIMALRRFSEKLSKKEHETAFDFSSEVNMKTRLCDISLTNSPTLIEKLRKIYGLVNYQKGDVLNIIHGNYEVGIVISDKYLDKVLALLKGEKILKVTKDLVSVALTFSDNFLDTPGVLAKSSRLLAWENVNIYEVVSTLNELNFVIHKDHAMKAYNILDALTHEKGNKKHG